jgi:hypothetical protein
MCKYLEVNTHPWYVNLFKADVVCPAVDAMWCLEKNARPNTHQKNPCGISMVLTGISEEATETRPHTPVKQNVSYHFSYCPIIIMFHFNRNI